MYLPNRELAVVDIVKVRDYCLNPLRPRGRHKARVFLPVLGLTQSDAESLRKELLKAAAIETVELKHQDEYGWRYQLDFESSRNGRKAMIRSAWIVLAGEDFPRFTSCYVLK